MTRVRFPGVSRRRRIVFGVLLVVAAVVAAIAANLALLGLAEERNDPVGKLSPKAVFTSPVRTVGPSVTVPPVATNRTETETQTETDDGDD